MSSSTQISPYYQHATSTASRISCHVRKKMFAAFMAYFRPTPEMSVLDVGVTSDDSFQESNYFEKMYPFPERITCVGTEDGCRLEQQYRGLKYLRVQTGQRLPFDDHAFDIVFSNAVVEHVGSRSAQRAFVAELCRVGKGFFISTPNRWFPVEHHTGLPIVHWLPAKLYRALLRNTRFGYWSYQEHLNVLSASSLSRLFPAQIKPVICRIRLAGICSNLVAMGKHN
jgi:SAM-dependent methyltransferase